MSDQIQNIIIQRPVTRTVTVDADPRKILTRDVAAKGDKGDAGLQGLQGTQGLQGVQGVKGDKGDAGTSVSYTHDQASPSDLWVVNHNLGKKPSVTVVDSGGSTVEADVTYIDNNTLNVITTSPFGGLAYCN